MGGSLRFKPLMSYRIEDGSISKDYTMRQYVAMVIHSCLLVCEFLLTFFVSAAGFIDHRFRSRFTQTKLSNFMKCFTSFVMKPL